LRTQALIIEIDGKKAGVDSQYKFHQWCYANPDCLGFVKENREKIIQCVQQGEW